MIRNTALILLVLVAACATQPSKNTKIIPVTKPLVTVADEPVYLDEFLYAYNKNNDSEALYSKNDVDSYLELYINFKLKVVEAKMLGYDTTGSFQKEFTNYKDQLDNSYLTSDSETERLVKEVYERMHIEVKVAHILFNLDPDALPKDTIIIYNKAMTIRSSIENGLDFGEAATRYSQDPSAKVNRGSLGYFTALQMVYPFETAAFNTPPGQISLPVRTRFGYHLIKVEDRRPSEGKVKVAHLMIRQPGPQGEDQINAIYDQLVAGASWDELCKQYSEDQNSAQNGGELAPFGRGQIVPEFEEVAFSLRGEGDISDPFKTQFGWHIVKLIKKIPLGSLDEMKETLERQVRRDSRSDLNREKLIASLMEENNFVEYPGVLNEILLLPGSKFVKGRWRLDSIDFADSTPLFSINGTEFTKGKFYNFLTLQPQQDKTDSYLNKQYQAFKNQQIIQYEKDHLAGKFADYTFLLNEYHDGILLFTIMEDVVWKKAVADTIGMRNYYEQNRDSYTHNTGWQATIFESPSREVIENVRARFSGKNKTQLLTASQKQEIEGNFNGSSPLSLHIQQGEYFLGEHRLLSELQAAPGDTLVFDNGNWYLIQIHEQIPAGVHPFDEIRGRVMADYQTYLENKWVEQLRAKYPVVINEEILNHVYGYSQSN
jgi:peptidyl-prolyl cis-trans isomerase SurA